MAGIRRGSADPDEGHHHFQPLERAAVAAEDLDLEDPGKARQLLVRLFDGGDYRITQRALREGYPILADLGQRPSDGALVGYVLRLLRRGHDIHRIKRGEPPDSMPRGWCMRDCDGHGLFIEMTIEEVRMGQQVAFLISFHR